MSTCEYIYPLPKDYDRSLFLDKTGLSDSDVIDDENRVLHEDHSGPALVICLEGFALSPSDIADIFKS